MPYIKKLVMKGFKSFARETEINLDKHINVVVGPNGSGKSCSYDTLVKLSNGEEIKIGELVEEQIKKSKEIKKLDDGVYINGDDSIEILSLNKDTGKIERKKISKFIKREGDTLYKIKTRTGKEVKATGCHPVMTFKEGEIKSVLIKNLNNGNLIASPRVINIDGKSFDEELLRFMGYIIGDGYISQNRIEFVNNDAEVILDYKGILRKFNLNYSERKDKNVTRIYINNSFFYKKIKDMFILNHKGSLTSEIKKIPSCLLSSNNKSISNLLAGLYDTDGSVRKDIAVIEFCTKNKYLAEQMQGLLLRYAITSKIKKRICCAANTKDRIKRDYFYLYIYGIENLKKFYLNVSLKVKHKKEAIENHLQTDIKSNPNLDLLPREINLYVKELLRLLGINYKPLRKKYPALSAYIENKCLPSRIGIKKILQLFEDKLVGLNGLFMDLKEDKITLINCMKGLNISGQMASSEIGLNKAIIMRDWATNRFSPRPENLNKFYFLIKETFEIRFLRIAELMGRLKMIANSDIYWDKIVSIEKLGKPDYVYDLTIENNHNFIANNIFVHNSNITDAMCFVLGRLSIKSMRAAKASHLIFSGNKQYKGSNEAFVEVIIDNTDKSFSLDNEEIKIRRIVRKNGQSIYKINSETKTRQEVLELLSQAGIDPYGFNIILQGEIEKFVKMPADDRRKVIEEVAGISIYEMRKEKSIKELERTEEKLKQINAIIRERTNYLKNLENEREQALKFKKLELSVKKCKASILSRKIQEKEKELSETENKISSKKKEIDKKTEIVTKTQNEISNLTDKTEAISKTIQKSSGLEQDTLFSEISTLKQEIAGLTARKENFENQLVEIERRKNSLLDSVKNSENEINDMIKEKGKDKKKELENKKARLDELDELKRQYYLLKSNLSSLNSQIDDKKSQIQRIKNESNFTLNQMEQLESEIKIKDSLEKHKEHLIKLKISIKENKEAIEKLEKHALESEKICAIKSQEIHKAEQIKSQVSKLDICPLCKTKITQEHVKEVIDKTNKDIDSFRKIFSESEKNIHETAEKINILKEKITKENQEMQIREIDIIKFNNLNDKKQQLKRNEEQLKILENEFDNLNKKKKELEGKFAKIKISDEGYETLKLEVNELARFEERNLGVEITTKQRELDRMKLAIKQNIRDKEEIEENLKEIKEDLEEKEKIVDEKEEQAEILKRKYQKMFEEKNSIQDKIRMFESNMLKQQNEKRFLENEINNFMISKAEINAKKDTLEQDYREFAGVEIIPISIDKLEMKLKQSEEILIRLGNVNLRALEVYDEIKAEYDKVKEKVEQLEKEKSEILTIISQIDRKKKKTFLQTLEQVNELFSRNFSQLSEKGVVTLEPQDKKEIFTAGLDIIVKVGGGKYFDVTSLSGGEQTLVALSLIFSIQEFKPYCFYIFDEIDAALDRRNSEKLAYLLKKYMKEGQYLIITHNDSIISEASNILYGVSMQEGISKVLSIEV